MSEWEWIKLVLEVGMRIAERIYQAVTAGDSSVLDLRVRDIIGAELATTIAKRAADEKARAKFGD